MKPKPAIQKPPLQKQPQQPQLQQQQQKPQKHSDFSEEYVNTPVLIYLYGGDIKGGKILEARRFWIKLESNNEIYYINKAFISYIQPVKPVKETPANGNTAPSNTTPTNGNTPSVKQKT